MAGYSEKSLVQKLGIKSGMRLIILNAPEDYDTTLGRLPDAVEVVDTFDGSFDLIQFFATESTQLGAEFPRLKNGLSQTGMLWVSWPKKAAKIPADLNENIIRETGLSNGLVDVKVCAVDERWSGLKFVYRLKDRT